MIQSIPAAIQSDGEFGINRRAADARMAPTRKYGRLRPRRFQVLSLMCPIMGCMIKPVTGAAIHKIGIRSISAPRV
jgi:hypothetical protein